ncbi:2-oxoglutarate dehydrogenase complex dihydrolipoyllysine-residue succinyltransferase [Robertmurraya yapensis]|uniref:Dihydrolipoyllysine-residue succinyltransferase component of 2-oxoglutarate dehydrogenase complex n=1 Tax=Bacillus yapensis TaxID=2492960 RepID=A0A431VZU1_9BACI|nr:2-oxoglutarate dehydrogenase complex dihydrolipoyllysine-residue succinyltransferase [Bacillus yapensis]RTR28738.1 2-oxoglutarate dehydrogenase complex dihydrolipoyllysine-residue succinyltransferase [Bacillus yapensis]TKS94595.1 2-oxoglutarate dehydrogenase complex dihydrolipoyllysine-residue succinyltransferase [Bacillus yapensis]
MAEVRIPELAESITEGTVAQWLKKLGDQVEKGDYLVELETDKVNVEIISDFSGVLSEVRYNEGDTVNVGEVIAVVEEGGVASPPAPKEAPVQKEEAPAAQAPVETPKAVEETVDKNGRPIASPSARRIAREKGIDLTAVPTVDPLGRVRAQDVQNYNPQAKTAQSAPAPAPAAKQEVAVDSNKPVERIRMSRRRQTIANRLVEVQQTAAMLTTFNEVDMTNVMNLRKRRKDQFQEENDVKLGFMSFFTKAVVAALKKSPLLNAEIQGDEILLKKFYDIGIAVSAPEGLVVPVVRDADRKNFAEIEKDILHLADKARQNKLALNDLQGGTFTITNGGVFGSLMSTPILNGPQVGILGMHSVKLRPVAIDEEKMENRPMMYIALSYDHRIVDGKEAVTFLKRVKDLIEDPESLIFE